MNTKEEDRRVLKFIEYTNKKLDEMLKALSPEMIADLQKPESRYYQKGYSIPYLTIEEFLIEARIWVKAKDKATLLAPE